jgi:hypothetical protein
MTEIVLNAGERFFASRAKDLLVARQSFRFIVEGRQAEALRPFLVEGRIVNASRMGLNSLTQPILGLLLIAEGQGHRVAFMDKDGVVTGTVLIFNP